MLKQLPVRSLALDFVRSFGSMPLILELRTQLLIIVNHFVSLKHGACIALERFLFSQLLQSQFLCICWLCAINFKISGGDFGGKDKYISSENLFKIPQRAGVDKIPLADLLKIHLDVEVYPQDEKPSRVYMKCTLKIRNASTQIEFITTALNRENTDEESHGELRLKQMNIVSPQRNIKTPHACSSPSTSKQ